MIKQLLLLLTITTLALTCWAQDETAETQTIMATYYSNRFEGRRTSSGEIFRQKGFTAAHKSLPFGTLVLVTNPDNGKQVVVKVNDRCPKAGVLDLTSRAAKQLGIGSKRVEITILPPEYMSFWENEETYLSALSEGLFSMVAQYAYPGGANAADAPAPQPQPEDDTTPPPMPAEPPTKPTRVPKPAQRRAANLRPQAPDHQPPVQQPQAPLYDLELCTVDGEYETQRTIEQVPIHYRNRVEIVADDAKAHLVLHLNMKRDEIGEVQSDLYPLFPHCKVVEQQQPARAHSQQ